MAELVDVTTDNVGDLGFFCYKSKPKSPGYRRKLAWLGDRFAEGLRLKLLMIDGRSKGFIEYIPGEWAWRAVYAKDYLVIHCIWVIGQSKGKGFGRALLDACVEDARTSGAAGVAMVTSRGNWVAGEGLFQSQGFQLIDETPAPFGLAVCRFGTAPPPRFPVNWRARAEACGDGLTVFRSDQCPYLDDACSTIADAGVARGIPVRFIELESADQVREQSPSPYGLFGIVYRGNLLSYHYLGAKEIDKRLDAFGAPTAGPG